MEEVKKTRKKAAKAADAAEQTENTMTIEETFAALDTLIEQLESGKGSLEDAFKHYEEGMKLVKSCSEKIETIEKQILVLTGEQMEDGTYV